MFIFTSVSPRWESNPWPPIYGLGALTTELRETLDIIILVSFVTHVLHTARISNELFILISKAFVYCILRVWFRRIVRFHLRFWCLFVYWIRRVTGWFVAGCLCLKPSFIIKPVNTWIQTRCVSWVDICDIDVDTPQTVISTFLDTRIILRINFKLSTYPFI